jgi:hypothetical protein
MKKLIIAVLVILTAAASSFGAIYNNASIIFPLLSLGVGGRALGMGDAFTAIADDASAVYWNAAGLSHVKRMQIGLTYDNFIADTLFGQIQFAAPLPAGTIGADVIYMNGGSLMGMDDFGNQTESFGFLNIGAAVAYGIAINENLSAGIAVKVISLTSGSISSLGFAGDLGAMYKAGIFSAGLNVQNLGGSTGNYSMPSSIRLGAAVKALSSNMHDIIIAVDGQYLKHDEISAGAGVEYTYDKTLTARLGYKTAFGASNLEGLKGICGGIGIKYQNFNFDYALVPYGDLGLTQKATLSYSFGAATAPAKEEPAAIKAPAAKPAAKTEAKPAAKKTTTKKEAAAPIKSALYDAALALEKSGEIDKAVAKYREALTANAKIADGCKRLGSIYLQKNDKVEAVKCYESYLKLAPSDTETADWLKAYKAAK